MAFCLGASAFGGELFFQILFISQLAISCVICSKGSSRYRFQHSLSENRERTAILSLNLRDHVRSTFHCFCTAGCRYAHSKLEGLKKGVFFLLACGVLVRKALPPFYDSWCSFCFKDGHWICCIYLFLCCCMYVRNSSLRIAVYSMSFFEFNSHSV